MAANRPAFERLILATARTSDLPPHSPPSTNPVPSTVKIAAGLLSASTRRYSSASLRRPFSVRISLRCRAVCP